MPELTKHLSPKLLLTHSLKSRLSLALMGVMLGFGALVAGFSFWQSYHQAQTIQDTKLTSLVTLAKSHNLSLNPDIIDIDIGYSGVMSAAASSTGATGSTQQFDILSQDILNSPTIIFWLADPRLQTYFDPSILQQLQQKPDGLYDIQGKHTQWRVCLYTPPTDKAGKKNSIQLSAQLLALTTKPPNRLLVAESADIRDKLAWQSATNILLPLVLLIPLLVVAMLLTINRLFRPLNQLTEILTTHSPSDFAEPTQMGDTNSFENSLFANMDSQALPDEVRPFIQVIQQQIHALIRTMSVNQRFVANAAHQLRTPMTAVLLQAEQLKHLSPADLHYSQTIEELLISIRRNNHLMNQLLLLAKSEQTRTVQPIDTARLGEFSAQAVLTQLLVDCYPVAQKKHISLGVTKLDDIRLPISELNFTIIAQNLIENALKYTPIGGQVDVALFAETHKLIFSVTDTGKGILEDDLLKITEPFYRTQQSQTDHANDGFGLGLSIVKNLVANSGAVLQIANRQTEQGLVVTVIWST